MKKRIDFPPLVLFNMAVDADLAEKQIIPSSWAD
jgi:hypothetical protein